MKLHLSLLFVFMGSLLVFACDSSLSDRVIVEVNGTPVMEFEFNEELDYQLSFQDLFEPIEGEEKAFPGRLTEEELRKEILSKMLIPMAVVKGKYKDRFDAIMKQAESIKSQLLPDGSNFRKLAINHSKDTNAKNGGDLGTVPRKGMPYPISRMAFHAEEKEIVGPFFSLLGCHILYIKGKVKGTIPSSDTVRMAHILLPFDENPFYMDTLLNKEVKQAKIKVIDQAFAALLEP